MNYEVQQELSKKADQYEIYSLQEKIRNLENDKRTLQDKFESHESRLQNQSSGIQEILRIMIEKELFFDNANELIQIKNYL